VHSVAMHDLLWRDEPGISTPSGVRFHDRRLRLIADRKDLRVIVTSPGLAERLVDVGIDESRLHTVRLGVDEDSVHAASESLVRDLLAEHGVRGPFTLYAGTREPRKNIERLLEAHKIAYATNSDLGPLVLAGPSGWGGVATGDAIVLGMVPRAMLLGLYRDATVFAYVPRAEGWVCRRWRRSTRARAWSPARRRPASRLMTSSFGSIRSSWTRSPGACWRR